MKKWYLILDQRSSEECGKEQGLKETHIDIAKNYQDNLTNEEISKGTGFTLEKIEALRKGK